MKMARGGRASIRWFCVGIYTALVTALSLAPRQTFGDFPLPIPHLDKAVHFGMYAVYAALLAWALGGNRRATWWPWLGGVVIFCSLYGAGMELMQSTVPVLGRTQCLSDALANALGSITGATSYSWIRNLSASVTRPVQSCKDETDNSPS